MKPEYELALTYAPQARRAALRALLDLDAQLGDVLRRTREPIVGQMRLTWWHTALRALDEGPPPAEPILRALAAAVMPLEIGGAALAGMTDGWMRLLDGGALSQDELALYAAERGGALFQAMAQVVGAADPAIAQAGEGWALADLALHVSDDRTAASAREMAAQRLDGLFRPRWSVDARALGALALLAKADLDGHPAAGSPARMFRLLRHRLTGR